MAAAPRAREREGGAQRQRGGSEENEERRRSKLVAKEGPPVRQTSASSANVSAVSASADAAPPRRLSVSLGPAPPSPLLRLPRALLAAHPPCLPVVRACVPVCVCGRASWPTAPCRILSAAPGRQEQWRCSCLPSPWRSLRWSPLRRKVRAGELSGLEQGESRAQVAAGGLLGRKSMSALFLSLSLSLSLSLAAVRLSRHRCCSLPPSFISRHRFLKAPATPPPPSGRKERVGRQPFAILSGPPSVTLSRSSPPRPPACLSSLARSPLPRLADAAARLFPACRCCRYQGPPPAFSGARLPLVVVVLASLVPPAAPPVDAAAPLPRRCASLARSARVQCDAAFAWASPAEPVEPLLPHPTTSPQAHPPCASSFTRTLRATRTRTAASASSTTTLSSAAAVRRELALPFAVPNARLSRRPHRLPASPSTGIGRCRCALPRGDAAGPCHLQGGACRRLHCPHLAVHDGRVRRGLAAPAAHVFVSCAPCRGSPNSSPSPCRPQQINHHHAAGL